MKFEYAIQSIAASNNDIQIQEILNIHGIVGWEIIAVINLGYDGYKIFMKRQTKFI